MQQGLTPSVGRIFRSGLLDPAQIPLLRRFYERDLGAIYSDHPGTVVDNTFECLPLTL